MRRGPKKSGGEGPRAYLPPIDATPEEVAKALLTTPPMRRRKRGGTKAKTTKSSTST